MKLTELLEYVQKDSYMDFDFLINEKTIEDVEEFANTNVPLFFSDIQNKNILEYIKRLFMLNILNYLEASDVNIENDSNLLNILMDSNLNTISNLLTVKEFTLE